MFKTRTKRLVRLCCLALLLSLSPAASSWSAEAPSTADLKQLAAANRWLELRLAATQASRQDSANPQPTVFLIKALRMQGELDLASRTADEALARFPQNADIFLERAWLAAFKANWPQALADARSAAALADARSAAALAPNSFDALTVQVIASRELHEWPKVIEIATDALGSAPTNADMLLNRGRARIELQDWQAAIADLNQCLKIAPRSYEAYYLKGRAEVGLNKPQEAGRNFTRALKLKPEAPFAYAARAEVLAGLGQWQLAARDAYTAIVLGARDASPFLTACQASIALGDTNALAEYSAAGSRLIPDNAAFHRFAGRAMRLKGDPNGAIAAYDLALKADPNDAAALSERAMSNLMLRRYAQAADDCSAALNIQPNAAAYALRAYARLKAADLIGADEDCENALSIEPREVTALLVKANLCLSKGRPAEAQNLSLKALRIDPTQSWAYVTCGKALNAAGRPNDGLKMLDQAISLAPDDGEAYLARGLCLAGLGRKTEAEKDLSKAATLDAALKPAAANLKAKP